MPMKKFTDKEFKTTKRYKTEQGYLVAPAILARTGTMDYVGEEIDPDGSLGLDKNKTYKVNRLEDDVFSEEAIKSFEGMPITITHPEDDVTAENWKDLTVGFVKNVKRDGDLLVAEAWVTDQSAVDLIENKGVKELSCGYTSKLVEDEEFDFKQTDIFGNHVAIVPEGRADIAKILDKKGNKMAKTKRKPNGLIRRLLDSIGVNLPDEMQEKVDELDEEMADEGITAGEQPEPEKKIDPKIDTVDEDPDNLDEEPTNKDSDPEVKDNEQPQNNDEDVEALKAELAAAKQEIADMRDEAEQKDEAEQVARDAVRFVPSISIKSKDSARTIRIKALEKLNPSYKNRLSKMKDAAIEALYIQETDKRGKAYGSAVLKDNAPRAVNYNRTYREGK